MHQIHTVVNEKYALRASDGKLVVFDKDRDDESASNRNRERIKIKKKPDFILAEVGQFESRIYSKANLFFSPA